MNRGTWKSLWESDYRRELRRERRLSASGEKGGQRGIFLVEEGGRGALGVRGRTEIKGEGRREGRLQR